MVALAFGDLLLGPLTGVDLSPRMLAHARAKQLYAELRESDIIADMATHRQRWPLIVAADESNKSISYTAAFTPVFTVP